jgi:hypothetical protein
MAHGIHLVPGIKVLHPRHQEIVVIGATLPLQGPMELEPAWNLAYPSPHSKRGFPSANPGPLSLKLWTLERNSSWLLSSIPHNSTWQLDFRKHILRVNNKKKFMHITFLCHSKYFWFLLSLFPLYHFWKGNCFFSLTFVNNTDWFWLVVFTRNQGQLLPGFPRVISILPSASGLPTAQRGLTQQAPTVKAVLKEVGQS